MAPVGTELKAGLFCNEIIQLKLLERTEGLNVSTK
jgi:hypothetical protein